MFNRSLEIKQLAAVNDAIIRRVHDSNNCNKYIDDVIKMKVKIALKLYLDRSKALSDEVNILLANNDYLGLAGVVVGIMIRIKGRDSLNLTKMEL